MVHILFILDSTDQEGENALRQFPDRWGFGSQSHVLGEVGGWKLELQRPMLGLDLRL